MYTPRTPPMHRRVAAFVVVLALAGCMDGPGEQADPSLLRNPTVPLGGSSRFDVSEFAGAWQAVACLGPCAATEHYIVATDGVFLRRTGNSETPFLVSAPGVLRQMGGGATLVVMWVDEGFRTAAIGDADGRWAAIIDRGQTPGRDRVAAATEILDFNGWDVSKLRKIGS